MTRDTIERLRAELAAHPDAAAAGRMLALLDAAGAAAFDRRHFDPGHFTASAFVLSPDAADLLLIRHAKTGRWQQPGGHFDPADASPLAAAVRETAEETGVVDAAHVGGLFDLDVHPIASNPGRGEPAHEHFDLRYLLRAPTRRFAAASDATAARWVPLEHLAEATDDASVLRAALALRRRC